MRFLNVVSLSLILAVILGGGGCSTVAKVTGGNEAKIANLESENHTLTDHIASLEKELLRLQAEVASFEQRLSLNYVEYHSSKRFVPKPSQILALPMKDAIIYRPIEQNSVVTVFDAVAAEGQELWLYVSVPVYDSPINMKGWIKESDTVALTKDNVKLVQSDVVVGVGTMIYEVFEFEKISGTKPVQASSELRGRLEEKKNGWARLSCPGGLTLWVLEKDLKYPEIE
ncbi:hypothetical protein UF75_1562 [Desulfosporosinus sp. I2]|uniref:bZIP transcription factor n=1 Tax=Desulfosporosinus sp. I2 TaxID=1617025 RepID=UPI0005F078A5|nr:bZIP transcription factor [Desulfosporosinus sp. I2]KJR48089.1 hypothetical protein UF75_1562 [Desulfosporosinus sp. I2]